MTRDRFLLDQKRALDHVFALTDGELEARQRFEQMAIETYEFLAAANKPPGVFDIEPESASNFLNQARLHALVSRQLLEGWRRWKADYPELLARNPRLELHGMIETISESHNASSWPDGRERLIQAWVDADDASAPPPFDDRYSIVTPEFYQRLRELRRKCGGWLYLKYGVGVVFAPEAEWQQISAAQEAAEAKRLRERNEIKAKMERMRTRLDEVMSLARDDVMFWSVLKEWELAREAKRRAKPAEPVASEIRGPMRMVQATPQQQAAHDNPPVDPIFEEFGARVRQPDDVLTVSDIVLNLRATVRREVGLDWVLCWRGGPGIGVSS
jgi:hypothetical protein